MPEFIHRQTVIKARRVKNYKLIETDDGNFVELFPGDWECYGIDDEIYRLENHRFVRLYDPNNDEARAYLETTKDYGKEDDT